MLNKIVLVFKTDVSDIKRSKIIIRSLLTRLPDAKINFDLEDVDKILRIEGQRHCLGMETVKNVKVLLAKYSHRCEVLY
jgi:hypothetical protein